MASPLYDTVAGKHKTWWDAVPQGSAGGWDAAKVQASVAKGYVTQPEADEIVATHGNTGAFATAAAETPPAA
jgi:hypothetical protein